MSKKIVCVGRNYAEHIHELNNDVPSEPVLFIKPASCVVPMQGEVVIPRHLGEVSHELELYLTVGQTITSNPNTHTLNAISHMGLGLDLTLRQLQTTLKQQGLPWEKAKSFDGACPLSLPIIYEPHKINIDDIELTLYINGHIQQQGNTQQMLFPCLQLLTHITQYFTLYQGDIIMTGTPAGVGPLTLGDNITAYLSCAGKRLITVESQIR